MVSRELRGGQGKPLRGGKTGVYRTNAYGNPSYNVAPDGKRFLMILPGRESSVRLEVAPGWLEELERRVPTHH